MYTNNRKKIVVFGILCIMGIIIPAFFWAYNQYRGQMQRELVLCLDSVFSQTMENRLQVIRERGEHRMNLVRKGKRPVKNLFLMPEEDMQSYDIDSLQDSKNVTKDAHLRFLYSVSFRKDSFQLKPFVKVCQEHLEKRDIQADLFFRFEDDKQQVQFVGDSALQNEKYVLYDRVMGYGNEFQLACYGRLHFIFDVRVYILVAGVIMCSVLLLVYYCLPKRAVAKEGIDIVFVKSLPVYMDEYSQPMQLLGNEAPDAPLLLEVKKKSAPLVVQLEEGDKYIFKGDILYDAQTGVFRKVKGGEITMKLNEMRNIFFRALLKAPNQTLTSEDLWAIGWNKKKSYSGVSTTINRLRKDLSQSGIFKIVSIKRGIYQLQIVE